MNAFRESTSKKKWTEIPAGELNAAEQRLRVALGEEASAVVERINNDPLFLRLMVDQLATAAAQIDDGHYLSANPNWRDAQRIMGENFFGVEDAMRYFGVKPNKQELADLWQIPYPPKVLKECRNSHILVVTFPDLTITQVMRKVGKEPFCRVVRHIVANYMDSCLQLEWQLVGKDAYPGSAGKSLGRQKELVADGEGVAGAGKLVYAVIGYYLATGKRLIKNISLRTSTDHFGSHVIVGPFDDGCLCISEELDDGFDSIGLAYYRRQPNR